MSAHILRLHLHFLAEVSELAENAALEGIMRRGVRLSFFLLVGVLEEVLQEQAHIPCFGVSKG